MGYGNQVCKQMHSTKCSAGVIKIHNVSATRLPYDLSNSLYRKGKKNTFSLVLHQVGREERERDEPKAQEGWGKQKFINGK